MDLKGVRCKQAIHNQCNIQNVIKCCYRYDHHLCWIFCWHFMVTDPTFITRGKERILPVSSVLSKGTIMIFRNNKSKWFG